MGNGRGQFALDHGARKALFALNARGGIRHSRGMGKKGNSSKDDPLDFSSVDREIHINQLKQQLRQIAAGDWHVDVLGGCSEEDLILAMRYYADDKERARWRKQFPDFPMPPRESPPYDRDRRLPQPDPPA
jgi:hypothetical protein